MKTEDLGKKKIIKTKNDVPWFKIIHALSFLYFPMECELIYSDFQELIIENKILSQCQNKIFT